LPGLRTAFLNELIAQARRRPDIFLVVGDLGYSVVEPFAAEFGGRFLNAGVAEQNMAGLAAGLASEGYHVFIYSIANFPVLRCLEQIRNDIAYHRLPVTVVSVGAGLAYGNLGYSHHAVQDVGIMRTIPELTIISPADPGEAREAVEKLVESPGPSYLRLGKAGETVLHSVRGIDQGPLMIRDRGGAGAIVACGSILKSALAAAELLEGRGLGLSVYSMPWLQPLERSKLARLGQCRRLFVVEEHVEAGGAAALLREALVGGPLLVSFSLPASALGLVGSQDYMRQKAGLSPEELSRRIESALA
jgi:transketolase